MSPWTGEAEDHVLQGNSFVRPFYYGVENYGTGVLLARNKVKRAGRSGVRLRPSASACVLIKNRVKKSDEYGFHVSSAGNLFIQNRSKKSGTRGLRDTTGDGDNIYMGNSFNDGVGG